MATDAKSVKPAVPKSTKVAAKPAAKKPARSQEQAANAVSAAAISAERRVHYVEVAAYYIAERRGFALGDPLADWTAAEAEIDRLLASGHFRG